MSFNEKRRLDEHIPQTKTTDTIWKSNKTT